VVSIALRIAAPASISPRWSGIMAANQIWPMGFAIPLSAMSGAEPWTGSKSDGKRRSGLMSPEGAMRIVPAQAWAQVREDVAEEVGCYDNVEAVGVED
jgi:hypothetical protein